MQFSTLVVVWITALPSSNLDEREFSCLSLSDRNIFLIHLFILLVLTLHFLFPKKIRWKFCSVEDSQNEARRRIQNSWRQKKELEEVVLAFITCKFQHRLPVKKSTENSPKHYSSSMISEIQYSVIHQEVPNSLFDTLFWWLNDHMIHNIAFTRNNIVAKAG